MLPRMSDITRERSGKLLMERSHVVSYQPRRQQTAAEKEGWKNERKRQRRVRKAREAAEKAMETEAASASGSSASEGEAGYD